MVQGERPTTYTWYVTYIKRFYIQTLVVVSLMSKQLGTWHMVRGYGITVTSDSCGPCATTKDIPTDLIKNFKRTGFHRKTE